MFIVSLTYKAELSEVEKHMDAHIRYLEKYYANGTFITSGRKVPRTGGVILVKNGELETVNRVIQEDPFYQADVANYDVIEFAPSKVAEGYELLQTSSL